VNELLRSFQFLVTFNGRHYDIPLLETRFILSRIGSKIKEMPNFDLVEQNTSMEPIPVG
jgi:uncharacterized protein YprB with RNaseH-like and TPR domain